jgi:DNA-binding transcriptional MocR family regulator
MLYERVAERLSRAIASGALRPSERLPSVRELARQEAVSVSTVLEAYAVLEGRGLIETRPQSGHYVRSRGAAVPEPAPLRPPRGATRVSVQGLVTDLYKALRDPDVVPLGAAVPSPSLLPIAELAALCKSVARSAPAAAISYDTPPGSLPLRRQIVRRALDWGADVGPEEVVTTCGAMEALHLCLRAVARPGDTIAVESPTYYGLLQLIESLELRAVEVPAHPRHGMDLAALETVLGKHKIRAVLAIPNFNNPLGSLMPDEAKRELVARLARDEIPLIEDDIYGEIWRDDAMETRPRPAKVYDRHGLVMSCGSFSKTLAPGFRVGWVMPGRFQERIEQLKFIHTVGTSSLPQLAIAEILANGGYQRHLRRLRRSFATQVDAYREAVAASFPDGTRVSRPQGGFVLWVELPRVGGALELADRALARGICIAPGPIFSAHGGYQNSIRLNCGFPLDPVIERAVRVLGRMAHELPMR